MSANDPKRTSAWRPFKTPILPDTLLIPEPWGRHEAPGIHRSSWRDGGVALVINLKTAKALGLTIAPSLLALADEVIE